MLQAEFMILLKAYFHDMSKLWTARWPNICGPAFEVHSIVHLFHNKWQ